MHYFDVFVVVVIVVKGSNLIYARCHAQRINSLAPRLVDDEAGGSMASICFSSDGLVICTIANIHACFLSPSVLEAKVEVVHTVAVPTYIILQAIAATATKS
jgi:hypothetical protein